MLSYHNDPSVKAKYAERFAQHRAMDEVIQGQGFEGGRGCFVGCTLDAYDHSRFPKELGWPEWLARLADTIFEGIPASDAAQFGTDLLEAVPVGVDLEPVQWHLAILRHTASLKLLESNTEPYAQQVRDAIGKVIAYCRDKITGSAARSAAESAWSAAWSAARSAAESAAWSAARSAARSAAESAWSAARSAAESAAESAWSAGESAESAAESAADSARSAADSAESAAESARSAAESAAWSARSAESAWSAAESARSAAWSARSAAESAVFQTERDALLSILKSMKA